MITDEDVLEYLEHFGVKGMHWGVRRSSSSGNSSKTSKTAADKKARRDKILKGVEIAGVVAVGAIAANYLIKRHKNIKVRKLAVLNAMTKEKSYAHIYSMRNLKVNRIQAAVKTGKINSKQAEKLIGLETRNFLKRADKLKLADIGPSGLSGKRLIIER